MRKFLKKSEINLVIPSLRRMIRKAWKNNEKVPYAVRYILKDKITEDDLKYAEELEQLYDLDPKSLNFGQLKNNL